MRYFVGFLIFVGLCIFGFTLFHHSGPPKTVPQPIYLPNYASTETVTKFVIDGPVVYNGTHREIDITVGQNQNSIAIVEGYQGSVLSSNTYPNNQAAYNEFLHALQIAGFTKSQKIKGSDIGACATGERYYLEVIGSFGNNIQNLWNSSCNEGTAAGTIDSIQNLFENQIPNYDAETSGVGIQ